MVREELTRKIIEDLENFSAHHHRAVEAAAK
jgi:hypothetical protein